MSYQGINKRDTTHRQLEILQFCCALSKFTKSTTSQGEAAPKRSRTTSLSEPLGSPVICAGSCIARLISVAAGRSSIDKTAGGQDARVSVVERGHAGVDDPYD
jgi:hypothetical protein